MKSTMKKILMATMMVATLTLGMSVVSFAAEGWKQNDIGWWYSANEAETAWCASGWYYIDGNGDNVAECYLFDSNGYMYADCITPDGYTVNADGAWTVNGEVQTIIYSGVISYDAYVNGYSADHTAFYDKNGKVESVDSGSGSTNIQDITDNTEDSSTKSADIDRSIEGTYYVQNKYISYLDMNVAGGGTITVSVIDENTIDIDGYKYTKAADGTYTWSNPTYSLYETITFYADGTMIDDVYDSFSQNHNIFTATK